MKNEKIVRNSKVKKSSQQKEQNKFVKFIFTDWPAKIICLVLAVILYMICKVTSLEKKAFAVPLEVVNAGNLTYTNPLPHSIRVSVRGENAEIGVLSEKDFRVFIDTANYTDEGTFKVPVHLELSDNATMIEPLEVQISPEYLTIDFEQKVSDLKKIKVNTTGSCAKGYEVGSITVEPDFVQISGNSRQVKGMTFMETNVINIAGRTESFSQKVRILNQNPLLSVTGNTDFTVRVEISPIAGEKTVEGVDVYYLGLTSSLIVENDNPHYQILLGGTQNELESFRFSPRAVYVDCSDIFKPGVYELPISVMLPPQVELKKIEPEKMKLKVISADKAEKQAEAIETEAEENISEQNENEEEDSQDDENSNDAKKSKRGR